MELASMQAASWLEKFGAALKARDLDAATDLFADECFWRDLVAFTWNLKTMEGRAEIRDMLAATLERVAPSNWKLDGEATQADGVTEAWITFETGTARAKGHVRLKDGKAWTLLTTMMELKGHEEKKGTRRIKGAEHGVHRGRQTWLEKRRQEEAELGYSTQPYCVIIGGGQGGIGLGARLKRLGVPTLIIERNERAGIPGASAINRFACTTRSGTTTCPTCRSRTTGPCSRPRTRSATGWRCTPG